MNEKTLKFVYEKSNNYVEFTVDSMFGGVSPHGLLQAYLIEETLGMPQDEVFTILDSGELKQESTKIFNSVQKCVHAKVNIPIEAIPSIVDWLSEKHNEYIETRQHPDERSE